jgi:nucleoside-diphosphate-sugar epimerase
MAMRVAVVGASGFFGAALTQALTTRRQDVTAVTRDTYAQAQHGVYDVVINTAMPSKRFWARQHPDLDFVETVGRTADLLYRWKYARFIQISSVSARCERDTVYGRHKATAEVLCERPDALVVRLTALYGAAMTKGAIMDMVANTPVYVDGDSRYAFTPVEFAAEWVADHLQRTGLVEVGARDTVSLREVADALGRTISFSGPREDQAVVSPEPTWPSAQAVIPFAASLVQGTRA